MDDIRFNDEDYTGRLLNENLMLRAQVGALMDFVTVLCSKYMDISIEKAYDFIVEIQSDHMQDILSNDRCFSEYWKDRISNELGDIPGIRT